MNSLTALLPIVIVTVAALLVLLLEVFLKKENREYLGMISVLFLAGTGACLVYFWNKSLSYFSGGLILDKMGLIFSFILVISSILVILMSLKYLYLQSSRHGEFFALILFALAGMMIMTATTDLIVIFIGLEVLSVSSYALAGLKKQDPASSEAAVKYFLLGSFASAFIVFGIALLFGAFLATDIESIIGGLDGLGSRWPLAAAGLALFIIGFGFKIAFVPFHMWTPDVYQGAPTPVAAFFSVGPKAAGFAVLLRILHSFWQSGISSDIIFAVLWGIAVLTMVIGNLAALRQRNIKRLLAYSSIAHAGYILVALLADDPAGLIFYLTVYLFMNIGAFAAVIAFSRKGSEYLELEDYAGLGFKYPWIGASLAVFLLSLAGFPPTGGFLAKFFIFSNAVARGMTPLVIIAVLASLISVFYYLRIVVYMYMRKASRDVSIFAENPALFFVLFICLYAVIQLGIYPGNILVFIRQAASAFPLF